MDMSRIFQSLLISISLSLFLTGTVQADMGVQHPSQDPLRFPEIVQQIVSAQGDSPIWTHATGYTESGIALLGILSAAEFEGLKPSDYHFEFVSGFYAQPNSLLLDKQHFAKNQGQLECLMTDAYLGYAIDLSGGRIEQSVLPEKWVKEDSKVQILARLKQVLIQNLLHDSPDLGLSVFRPAHPEYHSLLKALAHYRLRQGRYQWRALPAGPSLRPGMIDKRVPGLRRRFVTSGDHHLENLQIPGVSSWEKANCFDSGLVNSVRLFQGRHGLAADGIIGPQTLAALNVSDQKRLTQIKLNLERLRWLPDNLGDTHIRVNIPEFKLMVRQDEAVLFTTKAIVGRPQRPTPILSGKISSLVVNPYWNVPQKLARRDLLPKIKTDPAFLSDRNFKVYDNWSPGAPELDPHLQDWDSIKPWDMAFKFRQSPGPNNPLGQIKFMFNNQFSVFIHDTNHKERFASRQRAFSSGCVRIEDPLALAHLLFEQFRQGEGRVPSDLNPLLESQENQRLSLPQRVPVHLLYLTCWVDESGRLQYREDIYGYDPLLAEALLKSLPAPDRPGVDVDEVLASVETHPTPLKGQGGPVQLDHVNARHADIKGLSQ